MKKKIIVGIIIALHVFAIVYYAQLQQEERIEQNFTMGFRGVVLEKFNPRKISPPLFLKLKIEDNRKISIHPNVFISSYVEIGDSLVKYENSTKCYVKKKNGEKRHFSFEYNTIEILNE